MIGGQTSHNLDFCMVLLFTRSCFDFVVGAPCPAPRWLNMRLPSFSKKFSRERLIDATY